MQQMSETLPLLVVPFTACVVITSLHCYMGLHVIKRGVIFVDLALAQSAALGAAVALLVGPHVWGHPQHDHTAALPVITEAQMADQLASEDTAVHASPGPAARDAATADPHEHAEHDHHTWFAYGMSLSFALLGAALLSLGRMRDERIPHEAVIGIIFVVCAALSVLILSKAPHGHERMEAMLVGSILFVNWAQVANMSLLYLALGLIHVGLRKRFVAITDDVAGAERSGIRVKAWDCLFYATFALMVTQSVGMAGVLVVFSYLIIPAACATLFAHRFGVQLLVAWFVAVTTTVLGLLLSALGDMPTGSSLVSCFGAVLVLCSVVRMVSRRKGEGDLT